MSRAHIHYFFPELYALRASFRDSAPFRCANGGTISIYLIDDVCFFPAQTINRHSPFPLLSRSLWIVFSLFLGLITPVHCVSRGYISTLLTCITYQLWFILQPTLAVPYWAAVQRTKRGWFSSHRRRVMSIFPLLTRLGPCYRGTWWVPLLDPCLFFRAFEPA